ncbi:protoheme IX farnesyltransferase, mitochondrial-like [Miscanthus floridulus]|uniref:protoheme IX farnesyltransferase, mitochondrial-like n=1 Tax=Miscanthus floridulus TaxID=154761 RepID=UPI003459EA09
MMVAASANTLNQVFEIKNDAQIKRTMRRPLPSGRISPAHAAMWATSVGVAGTALLAWKANGLAAGLAASNLVLYAFVYTPFKQIHPVNTWVGAVVGAIPPLLGVNSSERTSLGSVGWASLVERPPPSFEPCSALSHGDLFLVFFAASSADAPQCYPHIYKVEDLKQVGNKKMHTI